MLSVQFKRLRRLLMTGMVLGSGWLLYSSAIAPLRLHKEEFGRKRTELQERLDSTRKEIVAIKRSQQKAGDARAALTRMLGGKAQESVMYLFPRHLVRHFAQFGLPSVFVRMLTTEELPELPDYQRVYWSVGLPIPEADRNVQGLLLAVAELDQQDRYIKVIDFSLQPDVKDPTLRMASISVVVLGSK